MTSIIAELIKDSHLLARGYYEEGEFIAEEIIADRISVQENLYREQPVAGEDAPRTPLREALQTKLRECFKANPPGEFVGERQIIEAVLEALRAATPEPCTPLTPEREAQARKVAAWPNHHFDTVLAFSDLFSEIDRLRAALRAATPEPRTDYNEPLELAKQRAAIVERVMKLPYIKATRDTEIGEERFVPRDLLIKAIHDYPTMPAGTRTGQP